MFARLFCLMCVLLLVGCGGGGGRGITRPEAPPNPAVPSILAQISQSSNSIVATDFVGKFPGDSLQTRADTRCRIPSECSSYIRGLELELAISDFNPVNPSIQFFDLPPHQGISMAEGRGTVPVGTGDTDVAGFGGWMDHNFFITELREVTQGVVGGMDIAGLEYSYAYSIGNTTGTNPLSSATWTGAMVGHDVSPTRTYGNRIQGNATLTFDLADTSMNILFDNIHDLTNGQTRSDIEWPHIFVVDGQFFADTGGTGTTSGNTMKGWFYGPNHEEVGGVFELDYVIGAFGARR